MEELLENIVIAGVATGPVISVIISVLKNWTNIPKDWIQPVNWTLAFAAIAGYNVVEVGDPWYMALVAALVTIFSSSLFHDKVVHGAKEALAKKSS